ncbi:MAG: T9SS type A sorting domain-containing protein [Bacteroidales bacterium]|nr:T9SS type A sorting domain-containing protein [Bacteroidales bacterium]MDD4602510.1 T9SS type A sorting domain-containing protein [Bacteroidales bacterium]
MKPLIRILLLSLFPCILYSQTEIKTHSLPIQILEGSQTISLNPVSTDLTISPDSIFFTQGSAIKQTVVVSNSTNQPINLLNIQSRCAPCVGGWGWWVDTMSVSTPHYIYPGQNISFVICYWTLCKDNNPTNFLQDSMYIVSSVGTQYCHIFLDHSLISSISEDVKENFSVFPNPATSRLTIKRTNKFAGAEILTIFNSTGVKIKELKLTSPETEISMNGMPNGIYLFNITSGNISMIQKIVKIGN